MKSLWTDSEAEQFEGDLGLRVYTSRLLGRDPTLVLHGGGNTSVKIRQKNTFGEDEDILYVKGSGWDLIDIEAEGFAPLELHYTARLAQLPSLSDPQMVNELRTHMKNASAPSPSVEAILHAILPYKYVDHTHANAVLTISNSTAGEEAIRGIYGDKVVIVPYVMPGFDLARLCKQAFELQVNDSTIGMILLNHGVFSFGDDARQSYERMIELVSMAEDYIRNNNAWDIPAYSDSAERTRRDTLCALRHAVSEKAGKAMILKCYDDARSLGFARRSDAGRITQQGPATPDHVIRTKRVPLYGRDLDSYEQAYRHYFDVNAARAKTPVQMLDPAPRMIIDPDMGFITVGVNSVSAQIVGDIYSHTMDIIERAEQLGGYRALPAGDIFDVEYWDLEQAKLKQGGSAPVFNGEIVLVTGAASGIGKACVERFLADGAAVVGLDLNEAVETMLDHAAFLGLRCDVTDTAALNAALTECVYRFGGLDMLVLNAGIFPGGKRISELDDAEWRTVFRVNLDANLSLMREAHPLLKLAPKGGRVVVIGSKNVPAPGPGAAAYSASKAALNQLARVAALEWGGDNIRINTLHPDAVFDTGIWNEDILQARASHYGMTVEQYKTKNILKTEISSRDLAALTAALCGPLFAKTTGAQIPIDGGNDRVI